MMRQKTCCPLLGRLLQQFCCCYSAPANICVLGRPKQRCCYADQNVESHRNLKSDAASCCIPMCNGCNIYSCYPSMQASKQFIKQRTRENPNTLENDCTCPRNAPQRGWLSGHLQQIGQGLSSKSQIDLQHVWEHRSKLAYDGTSMRLKIDLDFSCFYDTHHNSVSTRLRFYHGKKIP